MLAEKRFERLPRERRAATHANLAVAFDVFVVTPKRGLPEVVPLRWPGEKCGIIYNTKVAELQIVVDSNVLYAGLRSPYGASHRLVREIGRNPSFRIHVSVPLILEYEEVTKRHSRTLGLTHRDIDDVLDYLCSIAGQHDIFYLWRPYLPDPDDDMLLELAVEAGCSRIVTFNKRDFRGSEQFGVEVVTPQEFLREIGVMP
jgi:predicted nucleic acid-binding protein